ncbi:MAG: putative lipoic acid-binding regulatory protein [Rhodothermales bacterium]|jgi:putative lipoic acid-binding regulatory protein
MEEERTPKDDWWDRFQKLLDDQNEWPTDYIFKFIAPATRVDELKAVFGQVELSVRESRKGKYQSVTAVMNMHSSDEVLAIYHAVGRIDGVIAL